MAKKAEKNINEKITALYCRLSVDDIRDKDKDKDKDKDTEEEDTEEETTEETPDEDAAPPDEEDESVEE